ncbi:MAG: phosphoribosylanthranilate isomerase [Pseudomonadales bacterium]|nr:phosphoribosylanthranilate isomerase [Pseudomonadales bacterium]
MNADRPRRPLGGTIQVAGVHDLAEAELLLAEGVDFLALPLRLPDGREDLSEAAARRLFAALEGRVQRVLVTYLTDALALTRFADDLGCDWLQLHGEVSKETVAAVRRARPELGLVVALPIAGEDPAPVLARARSLAPSVDAFLTDTLDAETGRRGATGRTHAWSVDRALVDAKLAPVILAGGLDPANVATAVTTVAPAAVDVHTGVEGPDGRKDPERVRRFVARAREALEAVHRHAGGEP